MAASSRCRSCGVPTGTTYETFPPNYVAHICDECGADKRNCGSAPV